MVDEVGLEDVAEGDPVEEAEKGPERGRDEARPVRLCQDLPAGLVSLLRRPDTRRWITHLQS